MFIKTLIGDCIKFNCVKYKRANRDKHFSIYVTSKKKSSLVDWYIADNQII